MPTYPVTSYCSPDRAVPCHMEIEALTTKAPFQPQTLSPHPPKIPRFSAFSTSFCVFPFFDPPPFVFFLFRTEQRLHIHLPLPHACTSPHRRQRARYPSCRTACAPLYIPLVAHGFPPCFSCLALWTVQ